MLKRRIHSVEDFISLTDSLLGESEWLCINQKLINNFADVTKDHQWIHVDEKKIHEESPYGVAIAHGYLLVALIPYFMDQICKFENLDRIVNYGMDKIVFSAPVPVNSKLRLRAFLKSAKDLGEICFATIQCVFEIEGVAKPVMEGNIKYLYYFKS